LIFVVRFAPSLIKKNIQMKKFLAIIAITSIMASCTDSSTTEETSADTTAPLQSAPDSSSITPDSSALRADTSAVKSDTSAVK
jgi:uncharacterized lipoprotein YajG